MRYRSLALIFFVTCAITYAGLATAQDIDIESKIPTFNQMSQKATDQGHIRVIVRLDVPELTSLAAASAQFKVGRTDALAMVQAALADGALMAQIAATADSVFNHMDSSNVQVLRRYTALPLVALDVSPEALTTLAQNPQVVQITEDRLVRPSLIDTTNIIGASNSWDNGYTGTGWYVAILDTGIRSSHEFFSGKEIVEACFAFGSPLLPSGSGHCPDDSKSMTGTGAAAHHPSSYTGWDHGTHVAGIAAGNNGATLYGVARDADIIAVQVFSRFEDDTLRCPGPDFDCVLAYTSDVIAGLDHIYSLRNFYNIAAVNLSLGGAEEESAACDENSYKAAIDQLRNAGIATVAASGNEGYCNGIGAPACVSTAISVGASNDADILASFSNYHEDLLDVFAPGVNINSSVGDSDSSYESWNGTSMATPHVTGAFALLRQADDTSSVTELLNTLTDSGAAATGSTNCGTLGTALPVSRIQVDDAIIPPAPDGLAATASDWDQIDLIWNDNANNEEGFKIERKTGAGGIYGEIDSVGTDTTTYSDSASLSEATTYYYRVRAYGITDSDFSAEANTTTNLIPPEALIATVVSDTQIDLTWTDNSSAESGFEVNRRTSGGSYSQIGTLGANSTQFSDTNLTAGTTYDYRIRSTNGTLLSLYAETSTRTTGGGGGGGSSGCFLSTITK